jgi:hypothetical protein
MTIYDPRYEVAWQLSKDDNEEDLVDVRDQDSRSARENFESLARFTGLLAGAEVAAITLCRGEGLIIELTDPPSPWLAPGAFMRAQPSNSADDSWSVESLLEGTLRWCWCKAPAGFCSAALIGGPSLVASRRLLLVANREGRLSEVNLGLAASYLAQARRTSAGGAGVRPDSGGSGDDVALIEGSSPVGRGDVPALRLSPTSGTEGTSPAQGRPSDGG